MRSSSAAVAARYVLGVWPAMRTNSTCFDALAVRTCVSNRAHAAITAVRIVALFAAAAAAAGPAQSVRQLAHFTADCHS